MIPDYSKPSLISISTEEGSISFTAPSNGYIIGIWFWRRTSEKLFILAFVGMISIRQQGNSNENIGSIFPVKKGDVVGINFCFSQKNNGIYFVPTVWLNSKGKIRTGKNEFKGDLDTIPTTTGELSLYWFSRSNITNGISGVETNTNYGTILTIPSTSNNYGVQFAFFNSSENSFYFRKKNGGTWNTWKKIS